ncbi:EamA-like transporter family protein [Variibacter gotjawalensis]|uniref:EamA-like transporter family protein n=1 Tax=Variibacter gotjawalensis TaxID=1333996 RepID=A0A0S3PZZ8_9BRAD|nr:DMT family transporter [Variibacter gotjawalensis]NIK47134.1 drug/metabolite transporter (DMT)-like permease [Variibacter gotjawalensis]BAT61296.1 EamA-like transporter family protein [Variibacter gotjawalensis]
MLLSLRGGRSVGQIERRAVGFALLTSATISGYSIVDGVGARVSANPHAYTIALFVFDEIAILLFAWWRRGASIVHGVSATWKVALFGGALSLAAYWIAIWAMTVAPIAIVAALRETSVLFAAGIAVFFLGEPLRRSRVAAAAIIVTGLALIRLA